MTILSGFTKANQFYTLFKSASPSDQLLVFLHGLGSSQNFYYTIANRFPSHNVLLLDHEGAGQSSLLHKPNNLTLETLSQNIISMLDELKLRDFKITLIGHSMSGLLINYINIYTDLPITRNVLIAPVHPTIPLNQAMQGRVDTLEKSKNMIELSNVIPHAATGSNASGLQIAFIRQLIQNNSVDGYIANCGAIMSAAEKYVLDYTKVKPPTLVIYGKQDKTSPWKGCIEEITSKLPNVTLKELDVGHWIVIEDDSGVENAIKSFIN
ncbi:hypothetical protein SBY92_003273 [Candida maltosa Xu316]